MSTILNNSFGSLGVARSDSDAYIPRPLALISHFDVETSIGDLAVQAAALPALSLVGRITSSGQLTLSSPTASDGSQVPVGLTIADVPHTGNVEKVTFYRTGGWNYDALNLAAGWTIEKLRIAVETSGASLFFDTRRTASPSV